MINNAEFLKKEQQQSHSFIFFDQGPPYYELGWKKYRQFNNLINECLQNFRTDHGVEIHLYEHEIISVEAAFLWGFSFFETDPQEREKLTGLLLSEIAKIMDSFPTLKGRGILNNHGSDFCLPPDLAMHYTDLVWNAEHSLEPSYRPPKEKSYPKKDIDLELFKKTISVADFKKLIREHLSISSGSDLSYIHAPDGFFSNKYRANKYLREEFLPLSYFLTKRSTQDHATLELGTEKENFDAKITNKGNDQETIIEITLGCPKNDYLLHSLASQTNDGTFPLRTMAYLKKETDTLVARITKAIEEKHDKNYQDKRILMVIVPSEYTYQAEEYIIKEIIEEVRDSVNQKKGNFTEIIMLCGKKFFTLF
ncbi:hypothetical protein ACOAP1_29280 [Pseudomonas aeruginosa]